jgi:hypothetical protein
MRSLWLTRSYQGRDCRVAKRDCAPVHWAIQEPGISLVKPRRPFGLTDPKVPPPTRGELAGADPEAGGAAAEAPLIEEPPGYRTRPRKREPRPIMPRAIRSAWRATSQCLSLL